MTRLSLLLLTGPMVSARPLPGGHAQSPVVGVTNGNTITIVGDSHPEYRILRQRTPRRTGGCSKARLTYPAFQKEVTVAWFREDRHGRFADKVMTDGTEPGLRQVKLGPAWHGRGLQIEQSPRDRTQYAAKQETIPSQHTNTRNRGKTTRSSLLGVFGRRVDSRR